MGNSSCLRDYRDSILKIRAASGQPRALIAVAVALRSHLARDVSVLPYPPADETQLRVLQADTQAVNDFMLANSGLLDRGVVPSAGDAVGDVSELEQAYLKLGLERCVHPDLPGVPPGIAP